MQKPQKLLTDPGVFIVVHAETKKAYIGWCKNIYARFIIWERYFKLKITNPDYKIPIANLPYHPSNEWTFMPFYTDNVEKIKEVCEKAGYEFVNKISKRRKLFTYQGKTASLAEHAKDAGLKYAYAYYKISKGASLEEVLTESKKDEEKQSN